MMPGIVEEFRAGLSRGELLIQSCEACGRSIMYPRHHCPFCQSTDLGWRAAEGGGILHSYTVLRAVPPAGFEDDLPYALGVVKLAEGVQLLGRLWPSEGDGTWDRYACDLRVEFSPASRTETARRPIPWFRLSDDAGDGASE